MSKYDFKYIVEKLKDASFEYEPFKHIYIEDFFSKEHFDEILSSPEISAPVAKNDKELIDGLMQNGFKPISFPGCVTDIKKYIDWHEGDKKGAHHSACEGFGMALRLYEFPSLILKELNAFLSSDEFNGAIAERFSIDFEHCIIDGGIQKYLDGYEISPHPDIRKKAATFMVNINPSSESENLNHHTHYLKLKKSHAYVHEFWGGNENIERAWLPWDWAETVKQQKRNNSIVLFSPSNDTLHGVKAVYNHFNTQRTQLYGNLWFKESVVNKYVEWEQLDIVNISESMSLRQSISSLLPHSFKQSIRKVFSIKNSFEKSNVVGGRNI